VTHSRREQTGWYFYDWANSAFSSTVVTLFLGPYLTVLAKAAADAQGFVHPFGIPVDARSWWGYLVSLSVASQVVFLPALGAMADYSPRKRFLLALFAYGGAIPTIAMYWLRGEAYLAGGLLFLVANLSFGASCVVYNSYLPQIAAPEERDSVSSKGWGIGYLGGGALLALNLLLYMNAAKLGLSESHAVRISLASAGVWWAGFTVIPLLALRSRKPILQLPPGAGYVSAGFRQVFRTLGELRRYPQAVLFLLAYLLYNDAIQAVITLATQFGSDELKIPMSLLTLMILMVQFVAFFGAIGFNQVARAMGAKRAVMLALVLWTAVLVAIYAWVRTAGQFFAVAAVVALVMGGSQALSRSLYSQMIPKGKEAEYFGIYEISDKGTSWLCPLLFGLALQFTGSYRFAILSLILFFVLGLAILARVDVRRASLEAGNAEAESA
jgi:UMF1 family MFS transporter